MKIGIIGCSHSSGLSEGGLLKKSGGFNAWRGWPRELAKAYPQHEVHLFASPGGGQNNMESALRTCLIENFDVVLPNLQRSDNYIQHNWIEFQKSLMEHLIPGTILSEEIILFYNNKK